MRRIQNRSLLFRTQPSCARPRIQTSSLESVDGIPKPSSGYNRRQHTAARAAQAKLRSVPHQPQDPIYPCRRNQRDIGRGSRARPAGGRGRPSTRQRRRHARIRPGCCVRECPEQQEQVSSPCEDGVVSMTYCSQVPQATGSNRVAFASSTKGALDALRRR